MRFSLKWILAGTVYVAIAAAAFSQATWVYADLLWALSLLAIVYAALLAVFARGKRQVAAAGFVIAGACFLLCATFGGESVPTTRLLLAAGLGSNNGPVPLSYVAVYPSSPQPSPTFTAQQIVIGSGISSAVVGPAVAPGQTPPTPVRSGLQRRFPAQPTLLTNPQPVDFSIYVRAANAVATLSFGLMGSLAGVMAYRSAKQDAASGD